MANDSNGGSAFSWFLAGLGLGSLLGVLYAPRPGQETREGLVAGALGSTDYVKRRGVEAGRAAGDYLERGKGQLTDYRGQLTDFAARGKDQLSGYVATGKGQVNDYVSRGKDAVETGRQKINEAYNQGVHSVAEQKEKLRASYEAGRQAYVETSIPADAPASKELIPGTEHLG